MPCASAQPKVHKSTIKKPSAGAPRQREGKKLTKAKEKANAQQPAPAHSQKQKTSA